MKKRQRRIDEILGAAILAIKEVEVEGEDEMMWVVDLMEPASSSKLGPQTDDDMRKV